VVVVAKSVRGDAKGRRAKVESQRLVGQRQNKDGFTFGEDLFGVGAAGAATFFGKIIHRAVLAVCDPVFKSGIMRWRLTRSNASQDESQLARFVFDGLFEISQLLFDDDFYKDGLAEWNSESVCHLPGAGVFANCGGRFEVDRDVNFLSDLNQSGKRYRFTGHLVGVTGIDQSVAGAPGANAGIFDLPGFDEILSGGHLCAVENGDVYGGGVK